MPSTCAVVHCKSTHRKGISIRFFSFPRNEDVANAWLAYCGPNTNKRTCRVCSIHFLPSDYNNLPLRYTLMNYVPKYRSLRPDAVPSLHLNCERPVKMRQNYPRSCEICGRKERHTGAHKFLFFVSFPSNVKLCREWIRVTGNEDLVYCSIEKLQRLKICGMHFHPFDYNSKGTRLKRAAVPSLNLLAPPLTDEQLRDFPLHFTELKQESPSPLAEHAYTRKKHYDHTYFKETILDIKDDGRPQIPARPYYSAQQKKTVEKTENEELELVVDVDKLVEDSFVEDDPYEELAALVKKEGPFSWQKPSAVVPCDAEPAEQVKEEGSFSWHQPSAVVPCDADTLEKNYPEKERGTKRESETPWAATKLEDTGTPGHLEAPWDSGSPGHETSRDAETPEKETQARYQCNACEQHIHGYRYVCVQCADFDLCAACEAAGRHQVHYVLRVPLGKAKDEVETVLQNIRRALTNCIVHITEEIEVKEETDLDDPIDDNPIAIDTEDPIADNPMAFDTEYPIANNLEVSTTEDPIALGIEAPVVPEIVSYANEFSYVIHDLDYSTTTSDELAPFKQELNKDSNVIVQSEIDDSGFFILSTHTSQPEEQYGESGPRIVTVSTQCVNTSDARIVTAVEQCLSTSSVKVMSGQGQCAYPSPGPLKRHMPMKVIGMTSPERKKVAAPAATVRMQRLTQEEIKAALHKS